MREPAPEEGQAFENLLGPLFEEWIPRTFNTAGPGYLAYIPAGGVFPAAVADLISGATNRYTGVWRAAPRSFSSKPTCSRFRDWMGFPESTTRGLFTTGGSMSIFNAIVCARERQLGQRDPRRASSTPRTRAITRSRRRPSWPASCPIGYDRYSGRPPVSHAVGCPGRGDRRRPPRRTAALPGRFNRGNNQHRRCRSFEQNRRHLFRCRPLAPCRRGLRRLLPYGGRAPPALGRALVGLTRSRSTRTRACSCPTGPGRAPVRDGAILRAVHACAPATCRPRPTLNSTTHLSTARSSLAASPGCAPGDDQDLRRRQTAGRNRQKRVAGPGSRRAARRVPGIAIVASPQLSLFAFRVVPPGSSPGAQDAATHRLLERVNARGQVMMTGCTEDGRFLARDSAC